VLWMEDYPGPSVKARKCVDSDGIATPFFIFRSFHSFSEDSRVGARPQFLGGMRSLKSPYRWKRGPSNSIRARHFTIFGNPGWNAKRPPGNHATGIPMPHRRLQTITFQPFRYTWFRAWIPPEFASSACRPPLHSAAAGHRTGAAVHPDKI